METLFIRKKPSQMIWLHFWVWKTGIIDLRWMQALIVLLPGRENLILFIYNHSNLKR